ncbi:DUF3053 domain-containing protein [Achromobacter spanius]|uniref:DUF3053 domain-containing protein n=1 Tax=Achromobacter spanius TaxID=217203 RepID=UPI003827D5EA
MKSLFRPFLVLIAALPLVLAACGDKEPEQRAAFTQFLQTRIVDKPGVRVPKLTEEEKKSFGDYAAQYAVITDFNAGMDASVKPLSGILQKGQVRSVNDIVSRREDLKTVRAGLNEMNAALKEQRAKADAARAQLKQPEDLKVVYDKAYEKTITLPADTFADVLPQINATYDVALKVADYVEANKSKIEISGNSVTVTDNAVQAELNKLLQEMNAQAKNVQQAQTRLQAVVMGR